MSAGDRTNQALPEHLEGLIPTVDQILQALKTRQYSYDLDTEFVRAIDNVDYIGTGSPYKPHRFGPPPHAVDSRGRLIFTWIYLARDPLVASWESQLVLNNRGAGSGFHITRKAIDRGLIARIRFQRQLRLWSFGEDHSSRMGIHDIVSSSEHEACQWLGWRIRDAMLRVPIDDRPDGFVFPSRRVRGAPVLALGDWSAPELFAVADIRTERFVTSSICQYFLADEMRTPAPDLDAPHR